MTGGNPLLFTDDSNGLASGKQLRRGRSARALLSDYGTALAHQIRALAADIDGLTVPVTVHVERRHRPLEPSQ